MAIDRSLAAGRAALEAGRWEDARAAFQSALAEQETPEALDGMGKTLWWLGETRSSVEYQERAYAEFRRHGDAVGAAVAAMDLCITYKANFGNQAAASGWIARAERLRQDADAGPLQGWLWLTRAYASVDVDVSLELLDRALRFARDSGDLDLELVALADLGQTMVAAGNVAEGLALIDEAMAGTLGGECSRLDTVVFTCCDMLIACDKAGDLDRATQWCRVADADAFTRRYGCPFLYAECRTLYGGVLVARGHWIDGERELTAAVRMTAGVSPAVHAHALSRLADLRLRQGRLEEAETLLADVEGVVTAALPTATVYLARREPALAVALLERHLRHLGDRHIDAPTTLAMLVEAQIACGDADAAIESSARLDAVAQAGGPPQAAALALLASALVSTATMKADDAPGQLEKALELFLRLDLPLEAARVRLQLARALVESRPDLAVAEARNALAAFEQLGAATDVDAAAALLRSLGAAARTGRKQVGVLTTREEEVLRLVGLGLTNPEIAQRLFISRKTAAHHVSNLLAKLGLRNRAEAVAYAARIGIRRI